MTLDGTHPDAAARTSSVPIAVLKVIRPPQARGIPLLAKSDAVPRCDDEEFIFEADGRGPAYRVGRSDSLVTGAAAGANLAGMLTILEAIVAALLAALRPRASLVAENLVLRQQLAILRRASPRPRLQPIDRAFWVVVSRVWSRWAESLAIVRPATAIAWHRRGFARFWAWKSRRVGRPPLEPEIVRLIERMSRLDQRRVLGWPTLGPLRPPRTSSRALVAEDPARAPR
jgi:hypothetical protein